MTLMYQPLSLSLLPPRRPSIQTMKGKHKLNSKQQTQSITQT